MLKLYLTPNTRAGRVAWLLEELEMEYELEILPFTKDSEPLFFIGLLLLELDFLFDLLFFLELYFLLDFNEDKLIEEFELFFLDFIYKYKRLKKIGYLKF